MIIPTTARQVRLLQCAITSPGLALRAANAVDAATLDAGFDLLPYVQQIDIYESIFENTISGCLTLLEDIGLTEYLPIVGVEIVLLSFQIDHPDPSQLPLTFTRVFRVIGITNQSFPKNNFRLYQLQLATQEFVLSVSSRICRAFHGFSCHDAVQNILTKDLQVDADRQVLDSTFSTVDVVIPNYTPLQAINYFALLAQTDTAWKESNFLFFETMVGGFHFQSVANLIHSASATPLTFNMDSGNLTSLPVVTEQSVMQQIMQMHQNQSFDLLFDIGSGTLRSRLVHFDFLARRLHINADSRYTKTFDQTTHLDTFPVYPRNFDLSVSQDVRIFAVPSNVWSTQSAYMKSIEEQPEQRMHEAVVLRNRQLKELRHVETLIDLPGQPTISAGTVVIVNYPSSRLLQDANIPVTSPLQNQPTPYYSGPHLVTAVHHILLVNSPNQMEYRMNLKVNKDSFGAPLIGSPDVVTN
jgi:hypothetical protein